MKENSKIIEISDTQSLLDSLKKALETRDEKHLGEQGEEVIDWQCRVCGFSYGDVGDPVPWRQPLNGEWYPSYEICVCCNVQFGFDDLSPDAVSRFRERWLSTGGRFHAVSAMPKNWSLEIQLENISEKWIAKL